MCEEGHISLIFLLIFNKPIASQRCSQLLVEKHEKTQLLYNKSDLLHTRLGFKRRLWFTGFGFRDMTETLSDTHEYMTNTEKFTNISGHAQVFVFHATIYSSKP